MEFTFEVIKTVKIKAPGLSDAVARFHKECSNCGPRDLIKILDSYGHQLPYTFSDETHEKIYYVQGCPYGYDDCVFDPMRKIARSCGCQSELTKDMYKKCEPHDDGDGGCSWFDNEDK